MDKRKPDGYWTNPDNILRESLQYLKETGEPILPNNRKMIGHGYSTLTVAITKYFPGGIFGLRERLGQRVLRKRRGYWQNPENIREEFRAVMKKHKLKTVPSKAFLERNGRNDLGYVVNSYYPNGYVGLRKDLDGKELRKKRGYWMKPENALEEARVVLVANALSKLPNKEEFEKLLKAISKTTLAYSIVKYHGGFKVFRERLREYMNQPTQKEQTESLLEDWLSE